MRPGRRSKLLLGGLLAAWLACGLWQTHKPLPAGTDIATPPVAMAASDLNFLYDLTYRDARGDAVHEQRIFDAAFAMIEAARRVVVLDFFLVNDAMGAAGASYRPLSRELADRLLARKRAEPGLRALLITDPINDVYGGRPSPLLDELRAAGIEVVVTDLRRLRDSNPAYSAVWRGLIQWWGTAPDGGWLPNPFARQGEKVGLRSWLAMLNFKANHRKVLVADDGDGGWNALVTSANPHDASSAHSNVALALKGALARSILDAELDVARFSGWSGRAPVDVSSAAATTTAVHDVEAVYLTERAIRDHLLTAIGGAAAGARVDVAVFYLSDRRIIGALLNAAARGARVRLILDPNKDAFGLEKDGVPNRPVANELVRDSGGAIQVRWYRTAGEQFHTKLALVARGGRMTVTLGSANFTRRNLGNYNLEANVALGLAADSDLARRFDGYFERLWTGERYTAPFAAFRDGSPARYWRYRIMEATGLSTF